MNNPEETLKVVNLIEAMHKRGISYEDIISDMESEAVRELENKQ